MVTFELIDFNRAFFPKTKRNQLVEIKQNERLISNQHILRDIASKLNWREVKQHRTKKSKKKPAVSNSFGKNDLCGSPTYLNSKKSLIFDCLN